MERLECKQAVKLSFEEFLCQDFGSNLCSQNLVAACGPTPAPPYCAKLRDRKGAGVFAQ